MLHQLAAVDTTPRCCLVSLLYVKYALQTLRVGASVWFSDMSLFPGRYHISHRARRCAASNHRPRLSLFGRDKTDLEKSDVSSSTTEKNISLKLQVFGELATKKFQTEPVNHYHFHTHSPWGGAVSHLIDSTAWGSTLKKKKKELAF